MTKEFNVTSLPFFLAFSSNSQDEVTDDFYELLNWRRMKTPLHSRNLRKPSGRLHYVHKELNSAERRFPSSLWKEVVILLHR
jgi:hypothetical protein